MTTQELAQQILDLIKQVDEKWEGQLEEEQDQALIALVNAIEKLCKEQLAQKEEPDAR